VRRHSLPADAHRIEDNKMKDSDMKASPIRGCIAAAIFLALTALTP
jgi:hypothetical protein